MSIKKRVLIIIGAVLVAVVILAVVLIPKKGKDDINPSSDVNTNPNQTSNFVAENVYYVHNSKVQLRLGEFNYVNTVNEDDYIISDDNFMEYLTYMANGELMEVSEVTEGTVAEGDTVNISYVGVRKDTNEEFAATESTSLTIGSGTYIDGFEEGLVGLEVGSEYGLDLTFPTDYREESLAGVDVTFTGKIISKQQRVVPEITDDWVAQNFDYNTIEEFKEYYKEQEHIYEYEGAKLQAAFEYLDQYANSCEFISGIDEYAQEMYKDTQTMISAYAEMYGMTADDYIAAISGKTAEEFRQSEIAANMIQAKRLSLIEALGMQKGLTYTQDEYNEILDTYIVSYYGSEDINSIKQQLSEEPSFEEDFKETATQLYVLDKLFGVSPKSVFANG